MMTGFILAVLTGLTWTAIGVVLSRCARESFDVVSYSLAQTLITAIASFFIYVKPAEINTGNIYILLAFVFTAGLLNAIAQKVVKVAMSKSNHGPVWAISQSALIIPFLAGVLIWDSHGTVGQWLGTLLILGGIIFPVLRKFGNLKNWLLPTLIAFFMFGIVQTLYLSPSMLPDFTDNTGLRPTLASLGGFSGWLIVKGYKHKKLRYDRHTIYLAFFMSLLSLISLKIFFLALDSLSQVGLGNIGIPLIVGSNIIGFILYSLTILKEKLNRVEITGMILALLGIICLAL